MVQGLEGTCEEQLRSLGLLREEETEGKSAASL